MKLIALFVGLIMFIAGCAQVAQLKKENFVRKLGDISSCFAGSQLPPSFAGETYGEASVIYAPKDLKYDTKRCEWFLKDQADKVIIGQVITVGGCDSFPGIIELKKDDSSKKVTVIFVKNTAPPDSYCTEEYRWTNVWIAIDYIDGYTYETEVKTVVK